MSRMIFNKLVLQGVSYRRTIEFNKGLTVISGDKTSGKSLIFSLIDYCLGKSKKIDLKVQKELNEHCDQIFLELTINDEILTINRLLKEKQTKMSIYFCAFDDIDDYTQKTVEQDELIQLLMRKLNINEYKLVKHQKHSTKQELETVSFRDIFRYVYIHQHELGTHDFLAYKSTFKRNKNPHAFKLMFGLIDPDKDNLKQQLVEAKNKIEDANREVMGLKSYLKDRDAEDYIILLNKSSEFADEINRRKQEKVFIIKDSKNNKNNENEMYVSLKRELTEIVNQISEYGRQKNDLLLSVNSKKLLKQEYEFERAETNATLELNYKLVIPEHNIECPLCNSAVPHHSHEQQGVNSVNTLNKIKNDLASKIKLVNSMIDNDIKMIEELDKNITRFKKKQEILNNAVAVFTKETEVPFLSQIESINSIVNKLIREQEIIKECLRIHRKVSEKEKLITELENEVTRLEGELEKLNVSETYKKLVFEFLDEQYKNYMSRFKYDSTTETYIDTASYIPYYRGSSVYAHESGGLLLCMQLSYLSAILASKKEEYASGHPGILMLDSLSKYLGTLKKENQVDENVEAETIVPEKNLIHDPEVYEEIYKIIIELSTDHQIIIVENTPPALVDSYTKYTFLSGDKGLVNLAANELSELD
ncbi:hypothetical protein [Paenibacillus sp. 32352]|uniref:hypothetical protein n=1 Tax=Paenibacillus sp. 32352 TaxID=1969111 RepID=UPI0009AD8DD4|nr:hypothetical protein [Paenibacillus sp. 32352]